MSIKIWLCDLCYTQQIVSAEVMPMAIGGIATFCEAHAETPTDIHLFKYPEKLIEAMQSGEPHIVGFSNYSWNLELSYAFAEVIKDKYPDTVVVMGGPNYPVKRADQEQFLRDRPAVDFHIVKEGETPFSQLVDALAAHSLDIEAVKQLTLDGVHSLSEDGTFRIHSPGERITDLNLIPSPYLDGKMDEFFDGTLMPIIQTNRGCPFTCTYCTEGNHYFHQICKRPKELIAEEIDHIGHKMGAIRELGGRNDLFISDSNFGMYKEDLDTCRCIARSRKKYSWPTYILVGTGKNNKERVLEASRIISGAMRFSGSVQSLDPEVLVNIKRSNIDVQQLIEVADEANKIGANSYAEVILALPGDSAEKHLKTIKELIDAGFSDIWMFQLMVLPGAEIAEPEVRKIFNVRTHYRVVPRSFGNYPIDDERSIVTAEIEEIATSLDTLSFDDYLYCRRFNLMVTIFYNDGIFLGLLKLLRSLNISRYEWIKMIFDQDFSGGLADTIDSFIRETKEELWDSREELVSFTRKPENIDRFIKGELGANLIFKYKALATNYHLRELADVAHSSIREVLQDANMLTSNIQAFIDDVMTYEVLRKVDIFQRTSKPLHAKLRYDVPKFLESDHSVSYSDFCFDKPQHFEFYHDEEQLDTIQRALNTYSHSMAGMARMVAHVHIKSLYRHTSEIAGKKAFAAANG